jgi:hypothetical protein
LQSEGWRGTRVEIFELKGVTGKILETNELWLGEGISVMSYISVIVYSCGEVKGIAEKVVSAFPKWEAERIG